MTDGIRAEGLVKRFGTTTALAGLDLTARPGTVLGVLGPNGAGKTTAVRILATLLRPDAGRASIAGRDVVRQAGAVRRLIGLTGQYSAVDEELTGAENLVLVGRLLDLPRSQARARAAELLDRFELADAGGRAVSTWSGGMRRRLDLAMSLVGRPEVIFLDEPTTGLDPVRRADVWRMIRGMAAEGGTILLTTQNLDEADELADELAVIDHGTVIASGATAELKQVIGGQRIELRPRERSRADQAAAILTEVTRAVPDRDRAGLLTVPVADGASFARVVRRLDESGIAASELSLRLPSLDDVFVRLTGQHQPRPEPVPEVAMEGRA